MNGASNGILTSLRSLVPNRRLSFTEALRLAELQANRLLELQGIEGPDVPNEVIAELPRIVVTAEHDLPISGSTHWRAGQWIITLNADEPVVRQRFSLAHEFKHVLDHTTKARLYGDTEHDEEAAERAERAADHFAACLLMPKRWLKHQWFAGGQQLSRVAGTLGVPSRALSLRLWHLGLVGDTPRCARVSQPLPAQPRTYFRYTPLPLEIAA